MEYKPRYFFSLEAILEGILEGILALYPVFIVVFLPFLFVFYYPNAAVSGSIILIYVISIVRYLYKFFKHIYMHLEEKRKQKEEEYTPQTTDGIDEFEYVPEIPAFSKKDLAYLAFFVFWIFICIFLSKNPLDLFSSELSENFVGKFLLFINNLLYNHEILFSICCLATFSVLGYLGVRFRDVLSSRD
ncbi:MAG: hypothetical protein LBQ76_06485 [Candidatus Fibromonas sp.]|jgi:hypothetical protein|nr:hypothetical protein [Candidatus Fibromonas sp.]